ncbi:MAG: DUF1330 domain-containing protein [Pseudomonadota bacterium]|nr:DUF1330 domain-containing protein [Pseudomonadota bacterium]
MAAYMLAVCDITNMKPSLKEYSEKSAALVKKHGGKYIVRGPQVENYEGNLLDGKMVVLAEFKNIDDINTFINGDEYQKETKHLREGTGTYHVAIYEGV